MSNHVDGPNPLELAYDFRQRIKLGVYVWRSFPGKKLPLVAVSQATPFLPGVSPGDEEMIEMNWHVRLEEENFLKDLGIAGNVLDPETKDKLQSQLEAMKEHIQDPKTLLKFLF